MAEKRRAVKKRTVKLANGKTITIAIVRKRKGK
jgi:hypothetical protein